MTLLGSENHLEAVNQVECQSSLWPFCQSMKCCSKRKMMLCIVLVSCNVPQEHCLQPESWGNIVMSIMVLGGTGTEKLPRDVTDLKVPGNISIGVTE